MKHVTPYKVHPGLKNYPCLEEGLMVKGLGENESPQITVEGGLVVFSRWSEDLDDRVSFVITEWDLSNFVEAWVTARLEQKFPSKEDG